MKTRVRLLRVEGEGAAEFSDLVGTSGELHRAGLGKVTYFPANRTDWVRMDVHHDEVLGGRVRLSTTLGNVFVFQEVSQ